MFSRLEVEEKKKRMLHMFTYFVELFRSAVIFKAGKPNVRIKSNQLSTISVDINSTPPACSCTRYSLHIIYISFQHLFFCIY